MPGMMLQNHIDFECGSFFPHAILLLQMLFCEYPFERQNDPADEFQRCACTSSCTLQSHVDVDLFDAPSSASQRQLLALLPFIAETDIPRRRVRLQICLLECKG